MMQALRTLIRSIAYLRRPEALQALAELGAERRLREQIADDCPGLILEPRVTVIGYARDRLRGTSARISTGTVLSCGDDAGGFGSISIGDGSWVGQYNNLRASEDASISIGRQCLISQFCTLVGANHQVAIGQPTMEQPLDDRRRGVVLEDDVWLGAGCVILPGVTVARGSVVGSNSVVTADTGPYEIWAGIPARKIGQRHD